MVEQQAPEAWIGREVVFRMDSDRHKAQGILQSLSALGLTIRVNTRLFYGPSGPYGEQESTDRVVPVFYPWHRVQEVRLAEDEEKQMSNTEASDEIDNFEPPISR